MNKYSVWYLPYNKRYLFTHPWKWFTCIGRNIRDAWRRSVYGWTYGDVWDWDSWFLHVVPDMLRYMADHGSAYPGREPFETPERWHDWLHEMADLLETGLEDWQDEHNEYRDAYMNNIHEEIKSFISDQPRKVSKNFTDYMLRANELRKQGDDNVRRVFTLLGEHFPCLWD